MKKYAIEWPSIARALHQWFAVICVGSYQQSNAMLTYMWIKQKEFRLTDAAKLTLNEPTEGSAFEVLGSTPTPDQVSLKGAFPRYEEMSVSHFSGSRTHDQFDVITSYHGHHFSAKFGVGASTSTTNGAPVQVMLPGSLVEFFGGVNTGRCVGIFVGAAAQIRRSSANNSIRESSDSVKPDIDILGSELYLVFREGEDCNRPLVLRFVSSRTAAVIMLTPLLAEAIPWGVVVEAHEHCARKPKGGHTLRQRKVTSPVHSPPSETSKTANQIETERKLREKSERIRKAALVDHTLQQQKIQAKLDAMQEKNRDSAAELKKAKTAQKLLQQSLKRSREQTARDSPTQADSSTGATNPFTTPPPQGKKWGSSVSVSGGSSTGSPFVDSPADIALLVRDALDKGKVDHVQESKKFLETADRHSELMTRRLTEELNKARQEAQDELRKESVLHRDMVQDLMEKSNIAHLKTIDAKNKEFADLRKFNELAKQGEAANQARINDQLAQARQAKRLKKVVADALKKTKTDQAHLFDKLDLKIQNITLQNSSQNSSSSSLGTTTQIVDLINLVKGTNRRSHRSRSHRGRHSRSGSRSPDNRQPASSSPPRSVPRNSKRHAEASPQISPAKRRPLDLWTVADVRQWFLESHLDFMIPVCTEELRMQGRGLKIFSVSMFADYPSLHAATSFNKTLFQTCHAALLAAQQP